MTSYLMTMIIMNIKRVHCSVASGTAAESALLSFFVSDRHCFVSQHGLQTFPSCSAGEPDGADWTAQRRRIDMHQQRGGGYLRPLRETLQAAKRRWGWVQYTAGLATILLAVAAVSLTWHPEKSLETRPIVNPAEEEAFKEPLLVYLTLVNNPGEGVCLDGSPPGYHLHPGTGGSSSSWIVMLEGGGWCNGPADCAYRATTRLGSSLKMQPVVFDGILSASQAVNPDFHDWTRVKVRYCDGGSFVGNSTDEDNGLFFRGKAVWDAVMADLLSRGMRDADRALLVGCSAGALAAMLHCDDFKELLPGSSNVRCLSDAGFFMRLPDVAGRPTISDFYAGVVAMQGAGPNLPAACTSSHPERPEECFFPQTLLPHIRTPLFVLNPAYDDWQIANVLIPRGSDPAKKWSACRDDLSACSEKQLRQLQEFRTAMLKELKPVLDSDSGGLFVDSCFTHCQTELRAAWSGSDPVRVHGSSIAQAVGDWYFERTFAKFVDCPYPCNPSCPPRR